MAEEKFKSTSKRQRVIEKTSRINGASTLRAGKRRRRGEKTGKVRKPRTAEENAHAENVITKLLNEAKEAVTKSVETGDSLDSDLEILKDAVKEAKEADIEEDSDADSTAHSDLKSGEQNASETVKRLERKLNKSDRTTKKAGKRNMRKRAEKHSISSDGSKNIKMENTSSSDGSESERESDESGSIENHRANLDDLKTSDPEFYKYLKENDADLLEFGPSSANDDEDADEKLDSDASSSEEDKEGEALAAAEAGIDVELMGEDEDKDMMLDNSRNAEKVEQGKKPKQKRDSKIIDVRYLRDLQSQLAMRRTSLKACRDLLRVFRAGRELAVSSQVVNKSKKNALKAKKKHIRKTENPELDAGMADYDGDSDEELVDDKGFVAGEIRFASSKACQKAMNMAIIGIQGTLDLLLAKPLVKSENDKSGMSALAAWTPREHKRWENLEPTFKTFVYHIIALTEHMKDPRTLRFLLKRLELLVPYTKEQPSLTRKLTRIALSFWSAQSRDVSHATKLRAYLLLHAVANEDSNTEIVLRKTCQVFTKNIATICNPRTLPSIFFAVKCIVELFGINMGASYTIAFTHLREMAVTLRTVLTSKNMKADIEKIYNWTTVNSIRLWSSVLSCYGSDGELEPLIYPFVQVSLGILRVQSGPKNYPLRLQVCSFVTDLALATGVFIPIPPHLLAILRCAELKKVPKRGATRVLEWRSILRVADDVVGTKPYLGGIIRGVVMQLAKYFAGISKHVSFPEISHAVVTELRKFSKELRVPDWRRDIVDLCDQLKKTAQVITDKRAKADFGPNGALGSAGMLEIVPGLTAEMKTPIQQMYEIERKRKEREEALRDEAILKAGMNRENGKKNGKDLGNEDLERNAVEDEDEAGPEHSAIDEEFEAPIVKESRKNKKSRSKPQKKNPLMTLVASDEEPDKIAEFQLTDSEA